PGAHVGERGAARHRAVRPVAEAAGPGQPAPVVEAGGGPARRWFGGALEVLPGRAARPGGDGQGGERLAETGAPVAGLSAGAAAGGDALPRRAGVARAGDVVRAGI